jgi:hypothetical protein
VLHSIETERNERLLNYSTEPWKKTAILILILTLITQTRLAAVMLPAAFIAVVAAATASAAKSIQSFVISSCIKC